MLCPKCNTKTRVTDVRYEVMRRRKCLNEDCGHTFNTKETIFEGSLSGKRAAQRARREKVLKVIMSNEPKKPAKSALVRNAEARRAIEDTRDRAVYTPPPRSFGIR